MKAIIKQVKPLVFFAGIFLTFSFFSSFGQQISTVSEIYNYDAGDIFHIREFGAGGGFGFEEQFSYEITGKYYSSGNDTVFYTRHVKTALSTSEEPEWVFDDYLDTVFYTNLDSLINDGLIDTAYSNPERYNGRIINDDNYESSYYYGTDSFIEGCGGPYIWYYDWEQSITHDLELKYFKKGDEEWGEQLMVSVKPILQSNPGPLAYPNPVHSFLFLDLTGKVMNDTEALIYSLTGKLVLSKHLACNQVNRIDLPVLPNGAFILKVDDVPGFSQLILKN